MSNLQSMAENAVMGDEASASKQLMLQNIDKLDATPYQDQRLVIKGCGETPHT
jgi:hypothetical protein